MPKDTKSALVMAREGKVGHISIVGSVGWSWFGIDYIGFKQQLEALGDVNIIEVEINSPGGIVTDGMAILNSLVNHPATVHTYINGEAASIASVIAMAGDRIFIPDNSLMFLHKPLNGLIGNADDMRKMADDLDKFEKAITNAYQRHFKGSDEEVKGLMKSETWMTADEVDAHFENVTIMDSKGMKAAAHSDPVAILGDLKTGKESENFVKRVVNTLKRRIDAQKPNEETDMAITPEERKLIVDETTSAVVAALKASDVLPKAPAATTTVVEPVVAVVPPAPVVAEIPFEGDKADPKAVEAHLQKVQMKQLQDSADLTTPEGVIAYQKALAKLSGKPVEAVVPKTNAEPALGVAGAEAPVAYSDADVEASITRMSKKNK
jgi:ATP-dependent protease ClpP protease subunit